MYLNTTEQLQNPFIFRIIVNKSANRRWIYTDSMVRIAVRAEKYVERFSCLKKIVVLAKFAIFCKEVKCFCRKNERAFTKRK